MRFDYICAGLQRFTEDLLCEWVRHAVRATGVRKVLAAGGVFMNVKANKRIAELPEVESFEAFPSCGDETLSIGAYYLEAAKRFGDATVKPLEHFYLADAPQEADVLGRDQGERLPLSKTGRHRRRGGQRCWPRGSPWPAAPARWNLAPGAGQSLDPGRSQVAGHRARDQSHGQEARFLDAVRSHGQGRAAARLHQEPQESPQSRS